MNGLVITQAALHAALRLVRQNNGDIVSLDTLLALLDPAHAAPVEIAAGGSVSAGEAGPGATAPMPSVFTPVAGTPAPPTFHAPSLAAEEAQPAHHDHLTAGPGALHGAVVDTPAAEGAPPAPKAPPPAQAAEGRQPSNTTPGKWSRERIALLAAEFPTCIDRADLLARVNELPGEPVASVGSMRHKAHELGIAAPPHIARAIQAAAGQRGGRSTEAGTPTKPSEVRTEERFAAFPALWHDVRLSVGDIQARINAMPGKPMASSTQLYGWAKKAGLPTQRGMPDEAPDTDDAPEGAASPPETPMREATPRGNSQFRGAALPAVPDEKAEVFDAFTAGQTVRDVAADFGLPLSTLSTWHAEWKLAQRQKDAAE
jgi:hypothetical protein